MSSFVGGVFGLIMLVFFAPVIAEYAIFLGPPEYFMLMLLGLSMIIVLAGADPLKALIATLFGVLLSTIGSDYVSGNSRFVVMPELIEGIDFVAVIIGLFGIGEVLVNIEERVRLRSSFSQSRSMQSLAPISRAMSAGGRPSSRALRAASRFSSGGQTLRLPAFAAFHGESPDCSAHRLCRPVPCAGPGGSSPPHGDRHTAPRQRWLPKQSRKAPTPDPGNGCTACR